MYTQDEVLEYVKNDDVKFVRLTFFDLKGKQKNVAVTADQLERAFKDGIGFDASAIEGFEEAEKSDLFLHPDPSTLTVLPWRPNTGKVVLMFCDIKDVKGSLYNKDSRNILKREIKKLYDECGVTLNIGTEIEFYLFKLDENGEPTKIPFDKAGYMDIAPEDKGENIRRDICFTLEQMGIVPEASHHEEGPGQNEVDFHYSDALKTADNTATFKWIVRTKAAASGLYADFSPKPLIDEAGSGLHINISCSDKNKNKNIIAGILKHAKEITYYLNTTENSYNRIGKSKAPQYVCWGRENRSVMVRVPASKDIERIEIRTADPECNPYIAYALIVHAAIDGIKNNLQPPEPVTDNLFKTIPNDGQERLPTTLDEARKIALSSNFVKEVLGE